MVYKIEMDQEKEKEKEKAAEVHVWTQCRGLKLISVAMRLISKSGPFMYEDPFSKDCHAGDEWSFNFLLSPTFFFL